MKNLTIAFTILLLFLSSCADRNCPPLDADVMNYLPYQEDDAIVLEDENSNTISLNVVEARITDTKDAAIHKNECRCLVSHMIFFTLSGEEFWIDFDFASENGDAPFVPIFISNYQWSLQFRRRATEYQLPSGTIEDVIVYEKLADSDSPIYRIVLSRNIGIVAIEYSDGSKFELKTPVRKEEISPSDYEITYWC